jgi:uncharacterized protein YdeI (BOF family)
MPEEGKERQFQKRKPAVFTTVKNLSRDMSRVYLVGMIVSRNTEIFSFMLDDGTGSVNVIMNDVDRFNDLKDNQTIRVFGKIWGEGDDMEIQGDLIQDFSKIDMPLFKQVFSDE